MVRIRFTDIVIKTINICNGKILNTRNGAEDFFLFTIDKGKHSSELKDVEKSLSF